MEDVKKKALQTAVDWAKGVEEFTVNQAPDVVYDMLVAHSIEALLWALFCCVVVGALLKFVRSGMFYDEDGVSIGPAEKCDNPVVAIGFIFSWVAIPVFVITFFMNIKIILLIYFAPKYYIVKEIAEMIN